MEKQKIALELKTEDKQIKQIAFLVSFASVLQIVESFFPHPIPGIRLGLANMVTLVALVNHGFREAIEVAVLRTLISSFILGTFLSPAFLLSFMSALISSIVMGIFYKLSTFSIHHPFLGKKTYLSLIGISLLGAITHNFVQISLVYLLLIRNKGVFLLLPWLGISAVLMGWITGLIASQVCQKIEGLTEKELLKDDIVQNTNLIVKENFLNYKDSFFSTGTKDKKGIQLMSPALKIIFIVIFGIFILLLNKFIPYTVILLFLIVVSYLSKVSISNLFSGIRYFSSIILFSFIIPVIFNRNGEVLLKIGFLKITYDGLTSGGMFIYRIILLMLCSSLLMRTTTLEELTEGLKKILSPFKIIGISGERITKIITISLSYIPVFFEKSKEFIQKQKIDGKTIKTLIPSLSNLIINLYQNMDEENKPD